MLWNDFQRPRGVEVESESATPSYAKFLAQPFERGFATTIGNAMRRCLLSSIEGAAVTALRIEGVLHEFSSVPGVKEDVTDIVLNLKQIPVRLHSDEPRIISIDIAGPRTSPAKISRSIRRSRSSTPTPTSRRSTRKGACGWSSRSSTAEVT